MAPRKDRNKNITGLRFGLLTAVRYLGRDLNAGYVRFMWQMRCDCGNVVKRQSKGLKRNGPHSCGCQEPARLDALVLSSPNRMKDMRGLRFGKLLVGERAPTDGNNCVMWHCQCDCGQPHIAKGIYLRSGRTTHCGCGCPPRRKPVRRAARMMLTGIFTMPTLANKPTPSVVHRCMNAEQ